MERRRGSLVSLLLFVLMIFLTLSSNFNLPPTIAIGGIIIILIATFLYARRRRLPRIPTEQDARGGGYSPPTQRSEPVHFPESPKLGRWVVIPIILGLVVGFILFGNWYLNVNIRGALYLSKANIDWWAITYLNNSYFYAILAIGALFALSDPRLIIEKTPDGKRKYYLHSKFWGLINAVRGQIYEYQTFSPFPTPTTLGQSYDQISVKKGILWKLVEFAIGSIIIAPTLAKDWAFRFQFISKWVQTQNITWFELIQQTANTLYTRLFTAQAPTGTWLIDNSPIFEFLYWIRFPILLVGAIWGIRLFISFVLNLQSGAVVKSFRNIVMIGVIALTYIMIITPTQAFDVTTPYFLRTMLIGWFTLAALAIFLSLRESWVQTMVGGIFSKKIVLTALVFIVSLSLLYGPVVVAVQINPAMQGNFVEYLWTPKYLPNVEYTSWATGVEAISEDQIQTAMNTGENLQILSDIRLFSRQAAQSRLRPSIGVNWMDLNPPDIINVGGDEYWVDALKIVQPPGGDVWRSGRLLITHSERVLGINAHDGQILPNAAQSIFGINGTPMIYYGEGGLFSSSPMVYIGIPTFSETHLDSLDTSTYAGQPDYVLSGLERFWFFSGLSGQEQLRTDFGLGDYGDVNMLYLRDVSTRVSQILLPGMTLDTDPYLVSDGESLYYCFYVYIERNMPTEYLGYPGYVPNAQFLRLFSTVLVNTYDGSISGYLQGTSESNYVLDYYRSMYTSWNTQAPDWLVPQLRYPEVLFDKQIEAYNFYHVSDAGNWQQNTDFFQLTTNAAGEPIEEVRYVTFSLNQESFWAGVRPVEGFKAPGKNLAGLYVALNGKDIGSIYLLRPGNVAIIGPQTALDAVNNFGATKSILTLNPGWVSGNVLTYVINEAIYYFIPYYAISATTQAPTMMTTVDAISQKVGFYVISNPQDATEVSSATDKAYVNLVGQQVQISDEVRKQNLFNEFAALNYTLKMPQQLNPDIAFQEGNASYLEDADLPTVQVLIDSFTTQFVEPIGTNTILWWETTDSGKTNLNFGVLSSNLGIAELHYITVTYATG